MMTALAVVLAVIVAAGLVYAGRAEEQEQPASAPGRQP